MTDAKPAGRVHHERAEHVLRITIDNAAKKWPDLSFAASVEEAVAGVLAKVR